MYSKTIHLVAAPQHDNLQSYNVVPSPIGYRPSAIAHRLSPIAYRLSPIAYRLSAISYRLSFVASIRKLQQGLSNNSSNHPLRQDEQVVVLARIDSIAYRLSPIAYRLSPIGGRMDPTQLLDLARLLAAGIAPLIAGGALAKIGENATDTTTQLLGRAWGMLQRRFRGQRKAEAALTIFEDEADKPESQERVAQQIVAVFQHDPAAITELRAIVEELRRMQSQSACRRGAAIPRSISGSAQVGAAVAGDVHGPITVTQQSGGINFGSGNVIGQIGDVVAGNKHVTTGPTISGPIHAQTVNVATEQTITHGAAASMPAAPQVVLAAYAAPRGTAALNWEIEERALRDCLAPYPERFRIEPLPRATPEDLHQALLRLKPAFLHILSHGDAGDLLFQDSYGDRHPVPRAALLQTFANTPSLRCVILSACDSAASLSALGPGMPPLIAMRAAISSDAARAFAQGFYAAIAAEHNVRAAYAAGRDRMLLLGVGDADVPVLLER
jgi:hypothetical protein